ncbi:MAG: response regulator [Candidatus Aminicenantes bacterium]|nr:response regulator [Candidatus Aminicenantes bacterium]
MRPIKTLIADDSAAFRQLLVKFLNSQKSIEVVGEAENGHEAVEKAAKLKPDLILMDIRMPRMNGLKAMNQINGLKNTKVIVLTAFDIQEYREAAQEAGASAFVTKKSMVNDLIPAIQEAFKES